MSYKVEYSPEFRESVRSQVEYMRSQHVPAGTIDRWFTKLLSQIDTLEESPKRYPVDEIQTKAIGHTIRKMVFGDYLVFYSVFDDTRRVEIDRFMHGARDRTAGLEDLDDQAPE